MRQNDNPRCVYGLVDRFTGELRYIGQTKLRPSARLRQHINESVAIRECEKHWWICKHLMLDVEPLIIVLSRPRGDLLSTESRLIQRANRRGFRLLNRPIGKRVSHKYNNQFYPLHRAVRNRVFPLVLHHYYMSDAIRDFRMRNT